MTPDEAVTAYSSLSSELQLRVLADYAWELTVVARGTYVPGTEDIADPRRLRMLNEVQHRVIAHICHLLANELRRYPDDVLTRTVIHEDDPELLATFQAVIGRWKP